MDNVQKLSNFINILQPQNFRFYMLFIWKTNLIVTE
jgi:hypothetical protein